MEVTLPLLLVPSLDFVYLAGSSASVYLAERPSYPTVVFMDMLRNLPVVHLVYRKVVRASLL